MFQARTTTFWLYLRALDALFKSGADVGQVAHECVAKHMNRTGLILEAFERGYVTTG